METVNIFWTGGWDSTFRLLQLAEQPIHIHPIYILDYKRKSYKIEISTMENILSQIRGNSKFTANISDIEIIEANYILANYPNQKITQAWERLHTEFALGEQYQWFPGKRMDAHHGMYLVLF